MLILSLLKSYIFSKRSESLVRVLSRITLISSFLSVFSLVLVISIMNGFNRNMAKKMLAVEPHLSLSQDDILDKVKFKKDFSVQAELIEYEQQDLVLRTIDGYFSGAVARGLPKAELTKLLHRIKKSSENSYVDPERKLGQKEVILGFELASQLNIFEGDELSLVSPESLLLPAGEVIPVQKVRISQVVQSDVQNFDSKTLIYAFEEGLPQLGKTRTKESRLELYIEDPYDIDGLYSLILKDYLKKDAEVQTWKSNNLPLFFALRLERWSMSSLLSLSVLLTSFSLVMVLILLINQKRKDIGVMMAMGLSRKRVSVLFTSLGFLLAGLGSLTGLIAAVVAAYLLEQFPISFMPAIYADRTLPAEVHLGQVLVIGACLVLLAALSAWIPVRKLTWGQPSDNLRGQIKN